MSQTKLDEEKLVQMYRDPNITVKTIQRHFNISSGTVYRHLKKQGIDSNRKTSVPWTNEENNQLIRAREEGLTGAEMYERVPTRDSTAIKSRVQKLRIERLIR